MATNNVEIAAGGLVWRRTRSGVEVLLAHRPSYDDWAFPKGRVDKGEALIECGYREVVEETGFDVRVGRRLPDTNYLKPSGRPKQVGYWAMECVGGEFVPNREVDQATWLKPKKALRLLTYDRDRELLRQLPATWHGRVQRLIIVRHAEAGKRGAWKKGDNLRPLSKTGRSQAKRLVTQLRPFEIDRIHSSPATRCMETIGPLAKARSLSVRVVDDLWEEAGSKSTTRLLEDLKKGTTVMCTHRPIVERVRKTLGLGAAHSGVSPKGSGWIVEFRDGQIVDHHLFVPID
ncbi:MAG: NUDIX hydrolase [Acidimicrobiia bacterium]|nr:NUDIX hydrolase [Acidimicrobiia bacterium]